MFACLIIFMPLNTVIFSLSQQSEPSIFTKYQTKPQLFGGDVKEKGSLNFGAGKLKSVLEQFEINKKKIKDKHNRYANALCTL